MRIGIIHYKVGDTDGVSLEIDKWKLVLEKMGHRVFLAGGEVGTTEGTIIEGLFHHSEVADRLYKQTFIELGETSERDFRRELHSLSKVIERSILNFVRSEKIELLIVENIWSVSANPAAAIAMANVIDLLSIRCIAHSHDYYWERTDGVCLTSTTAVELADKYLPPRHPLIRHVVINSLAQQDLLERKGITSTVVPNVFEFDGPDWTVDEYNRDFRQRLGLAADDLVILQATRVVARKGIELAIDFVKALGASSRRDTLMRRGLYDNRIFKPENRIVLVLAGYIHDDVGGAYVTKLRNKIQAEHIDAIFIADVVSANRSEVEGKKKYSLWDTYVIADFVTYPSLWEGWGNQLLEAVRAKKPFLLFEYPVYLADIAPSDIQAVSLGNPRLARDSQGLANIPQKIIDRAADEAVELLSNHNTRQRIVDQNYEMGQVNYSLHALRSYLEPLIAAVE
jgi:glycosyltransferase involved in cell wall biosynthesis